MKCQELSTATASHVEERPRLPRLRGAQGRLQRARTEDLRLGCLLHHQRDRDRCPGPAGGPRPHQADVGGLGSPPGVRSDSSLV